MSSRWGDEEGNWTVLVSPSHWAVIEVGGHRLREDDETDGDDGEGDEGVEGGDEGDDDSDAEAKKTRRRKTTDPGPVSAPIETLTVTSRSDHHRHAARLPAGFSAVMWGNAARTEAFPRAARRELP